MWLERALADPKHIAVSAKLLLFIAWYSTAGSFYITFFRAVEPHDTEAARLWVQSASDYDDQSSEWITV